MTLEDAFWKALKEIAADRNMTLSRVVAEIDADRGQYNLSPAIRLCVLDHYRSKGSQVDKPAVVHGVTGLRRQ